MSRSGRPSNQAKRPLSITKQEQKAAREETTRLAVIAILNEQYLQLKSGSRIGAPIKTTDPKHLTYSEFDNAAQKHKYIFSPLTIALCALNPLFKETFINTYAAARDDEHREKLAFAQAFIAARNDFYDHEILAQIEQHAEKKTKASERPKRVLLGALATAIRQPTENNAGDLFDQSNHPGVFQNQGFLKFWWKLVNALFYRQENRQSKTFELATSFLNMPTALSSIKQPTKKQTLPEEAGVAP